MSNQHIKQIVDDIANGRNPLIIFEYTYHVHQELIEVGILIDGRLQPSGRQARFPRQSFEYRVDHGCGYFTQNTWCMNDVVPYIEDLPCETVAV